MANFLNALFKPKPKLTQQEVNNVDIFHNTSTTFSVFNADPYSNDVYRSGIDAIARNTAKLKPTHFINGKQGNPQLNRLLQNRPNKYMSSYDMLYKVITHYYLYNNSFIYIQRNINGNPSAFFPLKGTTVEFGTNQNQELFAKFTLADGEIAYIPYTDLIHLKRNFNSNDLLGDDNSALHPTLETAHAQNEGISKGIKLGANIRGILKFTNLVNDADMKRKTDKFLQNYLTLENNGGVVSTDHQTDYVPIDSKPYPIDTAQMNAIAEKIYNYLGINKNIVSSRYTEDEFQAFYESVIEPVATQLSMEFTAKCFTEREQAYGNEVIFESSRLNYSSLQTKINMISQLLPNGVLTINQSLEILNLPTVDDEFGSKRLQTLNLINADKADLYQTSKAGVKNELPKDESKGKETDEGNQNSDNSNGTT